MLKTIRGSSLQPSCARQHSPWIPSCSKAMPDLQLTSACRAVRPHHRSHALPKAQSLKGTKRAECKIQKVSPCFSASRRVKTLTFPTGRVSIFTLKYSSQQTKGSTEWHKVKEGAGSFPGDLSCSQPVRVIQVSKRRRTGDLPSLRESTLLRLHSQNDSSPTWLTSLGIQIRSKDAR